MACRKTKIPRPADLGFLCAIRDSNPEPAD